MRIQELIQLDENIKIGDHFDLELDNLVIETVVVDLIDDGVVIEADDTALSYLSLGENYQSDRPTIGFNPKPIKVGDGDGSDDYEYTRFLPRGKDLKTKWAQEEDVFKSNIRLAAKLTRDGKYNGAKDLLNFLMKKIEQIRQSNHPQDQEAAEYFGNVISKNLEKIDKKLGSTPRSTIKKAAKSKKPPEYVEPDWMKKWNAPYRRGQEEGVAEGPADEPVEPDMDADDKRWDDLDEAKYQGREVPLGKPMAGDVKKKKVYVRKPDGKVVKVNFGDKKMRIKKSNPERRKSFRARHNCKNPGPRWKARYWSCRAW